MILRFHLLLITLLLSLSCCKEKHQEQSAQSDQQEDTLTAIKTASSNNDRCIVCISTDGSRKWESINTKLPADTKGTYISALGDELVLATDNHGLFVSENNRTTWKDISLGLEEKKINALFVDGDDIYVGLHHKGISSRKVNGTYWNGFTNNLPNRNVRAAIKFNDELIVGTDMGIFKTKGKMQTWEGKHLGHQVSSLTIVGSSIFAGTVKGVMMSQDGGEHWKTVHDEGAIHNTALVGDKVFAMYISGDVFSCDTTGKGWKEIIYSPRQGSYIYDAVQLADNIYMSNNHGVLVSKNKGRDWELLFPEKRWVFLDLMVDENNIYGTTRVFFPRK